MNDGIETIYFNAHGVEGYSRRIVAVSGLCENTGSMETIETADLFVRQLQNTIVKIKPNREMEEWYMLLEEMLRNEKREGKQECLLAVLESKFSVSAELKEKIVSQTDIDKINTWFQLSRNVSFIEDFEQNM